MKKIWMVFPVLLCAGIFMMSCPSEPDEVSSPTYIVNPDYTLTAGKVTIPLTSIPVTNDGEYNVILDVGAVDDSLLGCHFKGSLFYVLNDERFLLAGALDAYPNVIAKFPRKYRWTFKAGEFGGDGSTDSATKGGYTVPTDGTVPDGATLEFLLTAMTPKWKYFDASDAENYAFISKSNDNVQTEAINYKETTGIKCGIKEKSSLVFRAKPDVTWTDTNVTVLSNGGTSVAATGKGNIQEAEWDKVKEATAGSILRFNCTVNVGAVGSNSREPGWGFGGVGGNVDGGFPKVRAMDQYLPLLIPNGMVAGSQTFDIDILVEDVFLSSNPDWSFVNTNDTTVNNQKINSIKIYSPQQ